MTVTASRAVTAEPAEPGDIPRYNLFERILHWEVAITFIALMLSGLALTYPRLAWLSGLFGGGQTMRASHPWIGLAFTVGVVAMLIAWARDMRFVRGDGQWARRVGQYARGGQNDEGTTTYETGQKALHASLPVPTIRRDCIPRTGRAGRTPPRPR